jgi:hypothetical protein
LSLSDISKYLKDLETNDLEDVFWEAISDGTIEKPYFRIDDRHSPYTKDINEYFDIDNYEKGGSINKKRKKVAKVMREFKKGKLHIGKSDKIVKDRKQAVAIALSEAGLSKKENGGWIEKLTFEEENFCAYVAEKFMGVEFDCEQKDCLKNIDKQKLKEKIISIKEQLSGDGLIVANSIIDKI